MSRKLKECEKMGITIYFSFQQCFGGLTCMLYYVLYFSDTHRQGGSDVISIAIIFVRTHPHMHTCTNAHTHTSMHAHMHTHTHTYVHTYTHAHTHRGWVVHAVSLSWLLLTCWAGHGSQWGVHQGPSTIRHSQLYLVTGEWQENRHLNSCC